MKHWWLMRVKRFCFFFQTNWKRRTCSLACPSGAAIFAVCFSFFKANYVDQLFLEFIYQVLDRRRRRQLRPLTGSLDREIWNNGNFVLFVTFLANFICAADRWQRHPDVPVGCFFFCFGWFDLCGSVNFVSFRVDITFHLNISPSEPGLFLLSATCWSFVRFLPHHPSSTKKVKFSLRDKFVSSPFQINLI